MKWLAYNRFNVCVGMAASLKDICSLMRSYEFNIVKVDRINNIVRVA